VGKESCGNAVLDKLNFKVKEAKGRVLEIEMESDKRIHDKIVSLNLYDSDGGKIQTRGGYWIENKYTCDLASDIPASNKCEIEIVVSENLVHVPFSADEIVLP